MCPENVGIATVRFQSLNNGEGNYVRHLWGTMRVCRAFAGCAAHSPGVPRIRRVLQGFVGRSQGSRPYFRGLAVDSRIVRTGLKVWSCSGCGEDLVDEVDTLWRGQEWAVLGVLVEVPDEGVEAGEGDADRSAA